ncbi:uncharacterized protein PG986_012626 [Apiospora aurea]|uniref:F-box domain-containing protein n=1 Tax=Apiospora aurea TaxID=335848 RepID=A0ABR1Q0J2_9PEZI
MAGQSRPSLSKLEGLPVELLSGILSEATVDGLYALIRASPTVYHVFRRTKASTLFKVCANDLGPAIRDAIILASVGSAPWDETRAAWAGRLLSRKDQWLAGVSNDEALATRVATINRTTQYFVDFYARTRFNFFEECGRVQPSKACTQPLSATERGNLSQALIRRQAIVGLYLQAKGSRPAGDHAVVNSILALFEAWEKEQIAQADAFRRVLNEYYPQLPVLRRRMTQAAAVDPDFLDRMLSLDLSRGPRFWGQVGSNGWLFLQRNRPLPLPIMGSSWPPPPPPPPPPPLPPLVSPFPCNVASQSPVEPPWGWKEKFGRTKNRWGQDLPIRPSHRPHRLGYLLRYQEEETFAKWRWAGFVFWDRGRAETLRRGFCLESFASAGLFL